MKAQSAMCSICCASRAAYNGRKLIDLYTPMRSYTCTGLQSLVLFGLWASELFKPTDREIFLQTMNKHRFPSWQQGHHCLTTCMEAVETSRFLLPHASAADHHLSLSSFGVIQIIGGNILSRPWMKSRGRWLFYTNVLLDEKDHKAKGQVQTLDKRPFLIRCSTSVDLV